MQAKELRVKAAEKCILVFGLVSNIKDEDS